MSLTRQINKVLDIFLTSEKFDLTPKGFLEFATLERMNEDDKQACRTFAKMTEDYNELPIIQAREDDDEETKGDENKFRLAMLSNKKIKSFEIAQEVMENLRAHIYEGNTDMAKVLVHLKDCYVKFTAILTRRRFFANENSCVKEDEYSLNTTKLF